MSRRWRRARVLGRSIRGLWPTLDDWRAVLAADAARQRARLHPRAGAGRRAGHRLLHVLRAGEAHLGHARSASARARSRAWRGRNPPTMPRSPAASSRCSRSAFRAIPVTALLLGALIIQGIQPGPAVHDAAARPVLGHRRQHVCRQRVPADAQPAAGRPVGAAPAHPLSGAVSRWCCCSRVVGTYSANKNVFDLWVMLGFGVAGYVLRKLEYDLAPFVIAFVLAPMLEQSLRQSLVDVARRRHDLPATPGYRAAARGQRRARRSDVPPQIKNRGRNAMKHVCNRAGACGRCWPRRRPPRRATPRPSSPSSSRRTSRPQPIEFTVVYPAGGGMDVTGRLLAKTVEKCSGDRIIVNNRTGGAGMVGHAYLATQAKPDGYTVGVIANLMWGDAMLRAQGRWSLHRPRADRLPQLRRADLGRPRPRVPTRACR